MGTIIAVCAAGGEGAREVIGTNLAIALATRGETLFADCAFAGESSSIITGDSAPKSLLDVCPLLPSLNPALLKSFLPRGTAGLSLLGGIPEKRKASLDPSTLPRLLSLLSSAYSFVVVNAPSVHDVYLDHIFAASRSILLILRPHLLSLRDAASFMNGYKNGHHPVDRITPLLLACGDLGLEKTQVEEYLALSGVITIPYPENAVVASINKGQPLIIEQPSSDFSLVLAELARHCEEEREGTDQTIVAAKETLRDDPSHRQKLQRLKSTLHGKLIERLKNDRIGPMSSPLQKQEEALALARERILDLLSEEKADLSREETSSLITDVLNDTLGFGCIEKYLNDAEVTEIMVNGPDAIYVERKGKIHSVPEKFDSREHLMTVIDRIVAPIGRRIDESSPLVDARLPDGSRVNAVIDPISLAGPCLTIRKFPHTTLGVEELTAYGAIKPRMADLLKVCVQMRKNIIISGGTGTGKTTLLNVLASFIPPDERIVTIEDSAELKLPQEHVVRLEARPPSLEGTGEITIRRLVVNALRMRPDRIVVGECRGGEALDMLQAMNTGHDGSLTTVHANSARDSIARLTTMVMLAGLELPERAIREQIASAIHIIVQLSRFSDGSRKITEIGELRSAGGELEIVPFYQFEQTGVRDGRADGRFLATGKIPTFMRAIAARGITFDSALFEKGELA